MQLDIIIENLHDAFIALDKNWRINFLNKKAEQVFMNPKSELAGRILWEVLPEELHTDFHKKLKSAVKTKKLTLFEVYKPSEDTWLEISANPTGNILSLNISNVTERKRSEEALRDSEALLAGIIEAATEAVITIDSKYQIIKFNNAAEIMFECNAQIALGQSINRFIPTRFHNTHDRYISEFGKTGISRRTMKSMIKLVGVRATGEEFPIEATISQIDVKGQKLFTVIIRDIAERIKREEQRITLERKLLETQKLESLGVLAGGIAHDFNNLLMVVQGNLELALQDKSLSSATCEVIDQSLKAARRASDLSNQMLNYSGKGRFVTKPLDLNNLLEGMMELLNASINKNVSLIYQLEGNLPNIIADPSQIHQVVVNLISNASEAIGGNYGHISVETGLIPAGSNILEDTYLPADLPEGNYVYLEIKDNGIGMDETTRSKIFEPFFTTKFTGRGLGLPAVLGIVRGHGGTLKVTSNPGEGTSFKILIPSLEVPAEASTKHPHPDTGSEENKEIPPENVLVIDDEEGVRRVVTLALQKSGYSVLAAESGKTGIDLFAEKGNEIGCVLLDMTMPNMSGTEVFFELQKLKPSVKVVLMSGYDEQQATEGFKGFQLAGFVQKPFSLKSLIQAVQNALNGTGTISTNSDYTDSGNWYYQTP